MRAILKKKKGLEYIAGPTMMTIIFVITAILVIGVLWKAGIIQKLNLLMPNFDEPKALYILNFSDGKQNYIIDLKKEHSMITAPSLSPLLNNLDGKYYGSFKLIPKTTYIMIVANISSSPDFPQPKEGFLDGDVIGIIGNDNSLWFSHEIYSKWNVSPELGFRADSGNVIISAGLETKTIPLPYIANGKIDSGTVILYKSRFSANYKQIIEMIQE
jgi:hypothetical protein